MTRLLLAAALLAPVPALVLAFSNELLPVCLAAAQTHGAREDSIQVATSPALMPSGRRARTGSDRWPPAPRPVLT